MSLQVVYSPHKERESNPASISMHNCFCKLKQLLKNRLFCPRASQTCLSTAIQESWKGMQNCFSFIAFHTFPLPRNSTEVEIGNLLNLNAFFISAKKDPLVRQHFCQIIFIGKFSDLLANSFMILTDFSADLKENREKWVSNVELQVIINFQSVTFI